MQAAQTNLVTQSHFAKIPNHSGKTQITTTLYELLEAIQAEVPPGNRGDKLATAVITHLLDAGRIRLIGDHDRVQASWTCIGVVKDRPEKRRLIPEGG